MSKFIMMIGIPGSGKSTYAEKIAGLEDAVVVSSDKMREELFGNVNELRKDRKLFSEIYNRVFKYLAEGRNVVLDATNTSSRKRRQVLSKLEPCYRECYYIKTPLKEALRRNSSRDRNVPAYVIRRLYFLLQEPTYEEGWDKINIVEAEQVSPHQPPE